MPDYAAARAAIIAAADAIQDAGAKIEAARVALEGAESPPVDPPVDPLPPAEASPIISRTVQRPMAAILGAILPDLSKHSISLAFSDGGRYIRSQRPVELAGQTIDNPQGVGPTATVRAFIETTAAPQLTFGAASWTATFTLAPFDPASPTLLGAPRVVGTVAVAANASDVRLTFDKNAIPEAWYMLGITGLPAGWDVLPYPVYVRHSATALPQTHTPVIVGSYKHSKTQRLAYALVPAKFDPVTVPLPPRTYPPITPIARVGQHTPSEMQKLAYTMLVPFRRDDIYRPSVLPSGVWNTANIQNYDVSSYEQPKPRWIVLDGPRGRGNLACATALRTTRRPGSGKLVFTDPWRVGTISDDGTIHTLAGYVHDEPPLYPYWNSSFQQRPPTPIRLVGDWSAMPAGRDRPWEFWDVAIDYRTTVVDESAPPVGIPPEHPHPGDVVMYAANTKAHNVIKITANGHDRSLPAKVTEFAYRAGGLPWGCETVDNLLIVTWSGANLIDAYDMDTGALVWSRPFAKPEGIRALNGLLYIGSRPSAAVSTMDIASGVVSKFCDVPVDGNSRFLNVAVAMDTFTPGVNVATTTWSGFTSNGWPIVYGPDGKRLAIGDREMGWGEPKGTYFPDGLSYPCAPAMDGTRAVWSTVQDGLHQLSAALPTDAVVPQLVKDGAKRMYDLDLELVYGDYGFGFGGLSARGRFGPAVDALLDNMGRA